MNCSASLRPFSVLRLHNAAASGATTPGPTPPGAARKTISVAHQAASIEALRRASEPHWAALALAGSSACAYDWVLDGDKVSWVGDPGAMFGLAGGTPKSRAAILSLMRPGARLPLDRPPTISADGRETVQGR